MKTKISLAQIHIAIGNLEKNFLNGVAMVEMAAERGSGIVLLPELWTSGYGLKDPHRVANTNLTFLTDLQRLSSELNIVIGGSYIISENDAYFNRFILLQPDITGNVVYDKIHIFRMMEAERIFSPGMNLAIGNFAFGKAGLAICYDLRFPELFRAYARKNTILSLLVAEWPKIRINHWNVLIQARAIENQSFFAAANAVGKSGKEVIGGCSMVTDSWGNNLGVGSSTNEDLVTVECDFEIVSETRNGFPSLNDQRNDLFS